MEGGGSGSDRELQVWAAPVYILRTVLLRRAAAHITGWPGHARDPLWSGGSRRHRARQEDTIRRRQRDRGCRGSGFRLGRWAGDSRTAAEPGGSAGGWAGWVRCGQAPQPAGMNPGTVSFVGPTGRCQVGALVSCLTSRACHRGCPDQNLVWHHCCVAGAQALVSLWVRARSISYTVSCLVLISQVAVIRVKLYNKLSHTYL